MKSDFEERNFYLLYIFFGTLKFWRKFVLCSQCSVMLYEGCVEM